MKFFLSAICMCVVVAGCSTSDGPVARKLSDNINASAINIMWNKKVVSGDSNTNRLTPYVSENVVFVATTDGHIYRIDLSDGSVINQTNIHQNISSGVCVGATSIFVTTDSGYLVSISRATMKINWETRLPNLCIEPPQSSLSEVIVRTIDAKLLAYNSVNGKLIWVYNDSSKDLSIRAYHTFKIIQDQVVLAGFPLGMLGLFNINTGAIVWNVNIDSVDSDNDFDRMTDIISYPAIDNQTICVATFNGKIACMNALSNATIWSKPFSSNLGILLGENKVYAIDNSGGVYAFDRSTGIEIWHNDILKYRHLRGMEFLKNNLLVLDAAGGINLLDKKTGKLTSRIKSDLHDGSLVSANSDMDRVIIQSCNGRLAFINGI